MSLELESLRKAVTALNEALAMSDDADLMSNLPKARRDTVKSGVIQAFEFTYELCWKFMMRWLEENRGPGIADGVSRKELFRLAAENLLIEDFDRWIQHNKARNLTSHVYDEATANAVYAEAREFAADAAALLKTLEAHND